jgi:hypothetical protein
MHSAVDAEDEQVLLPEAVLPVQFFGGRRKHAPHQGGEHRLLVALLEDAVTCFQGYAFARDTHGRRLFAEAARWINAGEARRRTRSFSFEYVCAVLDLDAVHLRRHLYRWLEARRAHRPPPHGATALRRAPHAAHVTYGEQA